MKKTGLPQEGKKVQAGNFNSGSESKIETDRPLSEKDQVKQAEERLRKGIGKKD